MYAHTHGIIVQKYKQLYQTQKGDSDHKTKNIKQM